MSPAREILTRDLRLAVRSGGGAGLGLAFFGIFALLAPLGVGPEPDRIAPLAPGVLWTAALLGCLLSLDRIFHADAEDGTLEILALSPLPLEGLAALKTLAHWIGTGVPQLVAAPVLGLALNLAPGAYPWMIASLAVGGPALSFIGGLGAALTLGVRRGGLLLSVIVLPLYAPTLIFGARTVTLAAEGRDPWPAFLLLAGTSLFVLATAPFATAAALRINLR